MDGGLLYEHPDFEEAETKFLAFERLILQPPTVGDDAWTEESRRRPTSGGGR